MKMATSSNFGNVFSVLGKWLKRGRSVRKRTILTNDVVASAWLPYEPIRPLQLLFQNLLYDFSQASIPW
jgi:Mg2+-importing ATPase